MNDGYVLLTEKESMWAKLLTQVLKDNEIPYTEIPVHGAGFVAKTGIQERVKVYVPADFWQQAEELLKELFPGETEQP